MLSQDIDRAARRIDDMAANVNEGGRVSMRDLRALQCTLRDHAATARALEVKLALVEARPA
jgi:hypothetical protein